MSLPARTFTESVTLMALLTGSKVSTSDLGTFYNLAYRQILESHEWSARRAETLIATVDPYTTGTVDVSNGSTALTGTLTVWTAAMTGRAIRIGTDDQFYTFTRTAGTTGTLDLAYQGTSDTDATYEIFGYKYVVDSTAGEVGQILLPNESYAIIEKDARWVEYRDPGRIESGTPAVYVLHGVDSSGAQLIEFWPRWSSATAVRIPYYKRSDDLSGSTKPLIRGDLVESLALMYAFTQLHTKFGDPHYARDREHWGTVFNDLLEVAKTEDLSRHNLPREVQSTLGGSLGHDFIATHDVDF